MVRNKIDYRVEEMQTKPVLNVLNDVCESGQEIMMKKKKHEEKFKKLVRYLGLKKNK